MKFIYTDQVTSITSSVGALGSDYSINAVENEIPRHPYISNSTSATITVICPNADALYFQALAEDITVTQKNSSNQIISSTSIDNTNKFSLLDAFLYENKEHIFSGHFQLLDSAVNTVEISINNSTDYSGIITNWVTGDSVSKGKFTDGAQAQVLAKNPQLRIGTFINHASGTSQINKILGDGTNSQDIQLSSNGNTSFAVSSINLPIHINTIRAGKVLNVKNPKVGLTTAPQQFDIIQEKYTGLVRRAQEPRKTFSGTFSILEADRAEFINFQEGIRTKPIAALIVNDFAETAIFGYFPSPPQLNYSYQGLQLYDISFNFNEIV